MNPLRQLVAIATALFLLILGGAIADNADQTVHQSGRMFSVAKMTIRQGKPVDFVNDDTVPHNAMSTSAGNEFDLGSQAPGTVTPVRFSIAGTVVVICAIHPRMHMSITVIE